VSQTYPVDDRCVLSAPVAWKYLSANCRLLVAELFRSPAQTRNDLPEDVTSQNHWPNFVAFSRHTCSENLFLATCMGDIN